jgi:hypothetical protein
VNYSLETMFVLETHSPNESMPMRVSMRAKKNERESTHWMLKSHSLGLKPPRGPLQILLTRYSAGTLDGDNLQRSLKHVRDGVADFIGIDDGSKLLDWQYAQEKITRAAPKCVGIRITTKETE